MSAVPPGRHEAEVRPLQPHGGVQRRRAQRLHRIEPVAHEAAQEIDHAALLDEVVREHVVGAQRQRLRDDAAAR